MPPVRLALDHSPQISGYDRFETYFPVAPNRLQRNFTVAGPNQAWVSDITYLWTESGWLYLAIFSIYTLGPLSAGP